MPKQKPKRKAKPKETPMKSCRLIQWERKKVPVDSEGNPICPECGKPAEMILGVFGQPCWAHE